MFRRFYENRIFPIGNMFAISPDRICEKSDPNHGLERLTNYDYFATFKGKTCQENKKKHVVTTKQ